MFGIDDVAGIASGIGGLAGGIGGLFNKPKKRYGLGQPVAANIAGDLYLNTLGKLGLGPLAESTLAGGITNKPLWIKNHANMANSGPGGQGGMFSPSGSQPMANQGYGMFGAAQPQGTTAYNFQPEDADSQNIINDYRYKQSVTPNNMINFGYGGGGMFGSGGQMGAYNAGYGGPIYRPGSVKV